MKFRGVTGVILNLPSKADFNIILHISVIHSSYHLLTIAIYNGKTDQIAHWEVIIARRKRIRDEFWFGILFVSILVFALIAD